jgi:hypothetical protein
LASLAERLDALAVERAWPSASPHERRLEEAEASSPAWSFPLQRLFLAVSNALGSLSNCNLTRGG